MKLIRTPHSNHFCGPAALALITGRPVDEVVAAVKAYRRRVAPGKGLRVKGMSNPELLSVLADFGIESIRMPTMDDDYRLRGLRPTLARWLRENKLARLRHANWPFLVNITGHYIVVFGRKIYDNAHPEGVWLRQYHRRRARVKMAWGCPKYLGNHLTPC